MGLVWDIIVIKKIALLINLIKNNMEKMFSETIKPNQEAWEEKRNEYLIEAVDSVLGRTQSQGSVNIIVEKSGDVSNDQVRQVLKGLILSVKRELVKRHEFFPSKSWDDEKTISDGLKGDYPDDAIEGFIMAKINTGA